MEVLPVDLVALVSAILGISVVLVPVIGLTARFALKPVVEALGRVFESRSSDESLRILERRVELQEQQIETLQAALKQVADTQEFDRQLTAQSKAAPARDR
ncbi:MAG: hypothetical protein ABL963_11435 [Longimicrobiales bacterium]